MLETVYALSRETATSFRRPCIAVTENDPLFCNGKSGAASKSDEHQKPWKVVLTIYGFSLD
jgi:hypothetical protein